MSGTRLEGRRVLILGGSVGIGKATGVAIAAEGGRVALAARRPEVLAQAVAEIRGGGGSATGIECDVTDADDCERVVHSAAEALDGLDAVIYAPGVTLFGRIAELDATAWRHSFDVNVVGATLVTRAAVSHLSATRGKVVYFSSIAIDDRPPRYGMAPYVASKVALESLAQSWQSEYPDLGFTTIAIGDTQSGKADVVSEDVLRDFVPRWVAAGLMPGRLMPAENVAAQVVNVLATPETVRRLAVVPTTPREIP